VACRVHPNSSQHSGVGKADYPDKEDAALEESLSMTSLSLCHFSFILMLFEAYLDQKQVDGSGLNHVYTPEVPDLTGILEFDKESSERPERRHFR